MKLRIRTRRRVPRWLEYSLLAVGVIGIGIWVGSLAVLFVWQDWQNWVFDREVSGQTSTIAEYLADKKTHLLKPDAAKTVVISPPVSRTSIAHNGLVGRLVIPRLRLRSIVREGVGQDTLGLAVGHVPGTALPGQDGNVAVAGHRDTLFRGLGAIRQDDLIQFETVEGLYLYEVSSTEIVKPQDVSVLRPKQYSELTLVTCYPFNFIGSAPDRFIVKARQVPLSALSVRVDDPVEQAAVAKPVARLPVVQKITFSVGKNHSRQLAPGISIGVTETDVADRRVNGWMWLLGERRTIWLRNQGTNDPVVFYDHEQGKKRELRITSVTANAAAGYLLLPSQ
jgi:sortase A